MAWDETEEIVTHRKFGQPSSLDKKREQISFDLATESDLLCRDYANGALLIELIGKVESGSVSQQSQGIMEIFNVVVETDDGEQPEAWTGRPYDSERPLKNHTQAELDTISDRNEEIREENDEIRERNSEKGEDEELEEDVPYIRPGIDPTSSLGRLRAILKDPRIQIEVSELADVVGWLVEQYTNRPTRSSSGSRPGGVGTGRSSRRAPRSRAGTSEVVTSVS
jgi:hypothetical protein